jgi:hypothetical protein
LKTKKISIIIPSWKPLNIDMQAETGSKYPSLMLLNGVPLVNHIYNEYERLYNDLKCYVIFPDNEIIKHLNKIDPRIEIVKISHSSSIGETINNALEKIELNENLVVHMADTFIKVKSKCFDRDLICIQSSTDSFRLTSLRKEIFGAIRILSDREFLFNAKLHDVAIGVFHIVKVDRFKLILKDTIEKNAHKLNNNSDPFFIAIELYSTENNFVLEYVKEWNDFGNIDNYYKSKINFQNLRHFNSLSYDQKKGRVTKISENKLSFRNQVRWYSQVPHDLQPYLPRIFDRNDGKEPYITMELLPIPSLSELYVQDNLSIGDWNVIGNSIVEILQLFESYTSENNVIPHLCYEMYINKTIYRIKQYIEQNRGAENLFVVHRNTKLNLGYVLRTISDYSERNQLLKNTLIQPIHGDLCFSNILYDKRNRGIKLIDPRGDFGFPGIFGDKRYDLAKLLHSFDGGYDLIVTENFNLLKFKNQIECDINFSETQENIKELYNTLLFRDNSLFKQCRSIQALLFLSMLPLHKDNPNRQLAFLSNGLKLYFDSLID